MVSTDVRAGRNRDSGAVEPNTPNTLLGGLPRSYRLALQLDGLGADAELIADCLVIEPSAVVALLEVGRRKLRQLEPGAAASGTAEISSQY